MLFNLTQREIIQRIKECNEQNLIKGVFTEQEFICIDE